MAYYDFYDGYKRLPISQKIIDRTIGSYFRRMAKYLPPSSLILNIGVGKGEMLKVCQQNDHRYMGLDLNYQLCKYLSTQNIHAAQGNCRQLGLKDNIFDAVYIAHVIEHMPTFEHALETVKEIKRVLKNSGYIIMIGPDYLFDKTLFYDGDYSHSFITTRNRISSLLVDCGFEVIHNEVIINGDFGVFGHFLKWFNWVYNKMIYPVLTSFAFTPRSRAERFRTAFIPNLFFIGCVKKNQGTQAT